MIKFNGKRLTPKKVAQELIEEALCNSLDAWENDTSLGQEIASDLTDREREAIDDQIRKIWTRCSRYL